MKKDNKKNKEKNKEKNRTLSSYRFTIVDINQCETSIVLQKIGKDYLPVSTPKRSTETSMMPVKIKDDFVLEKTKPSRKDYKKSAKSDLCNLFCSFPETIEDPSAAAKLQVLVLLSQVSDIVAQHAIQLPAIELDTETTPNPLDVLLEMIQGPSRWKGDSWSLNPTMDYQCPKELYGSTSRPNSL